MSQRVDDDGDGDSPPAALSERENDGPTPGSVVDAVIVGAGPAGLVLALALHARIGGPDDNKLKIEIYEQAPAFVDGVGGAIGMYANGLRVIRDIDDDGKLLNALRDAGYEYIYRRWYRHDGTEVCYAEERHLSAAPPPPPPSSPRGGGSGSSSGEEGKKEEEDESELTSIGIRRWKLQRILLDACLERDIPVHFGVRVQDVTESSDDGAYLLNFSTPNGHIPPPRRTRLLFGADGVKSRVRSFVLAANSGTDTEQQEPEYTGVTCLMGSTPLPSPQRGICFPSSSTTKCHMCTYPTSPDETIFQMYFPTPEENPESWGALGYDDGAKVRDELTNKMKEDGWSDRFVKIVGESDPESLVRVGLRARDPLSRWVRVNKGSGGGEGGGGGVALLGDAAHPPVPYIGQGAMMAVEDAGTLALILEKFCCRVVDHPTTSSSSSDGVTKEEKKPSSSTTFSFERLPQALELYQSIRIPRTMSILGKSVVLGKTQQDRADSRFYGMWREWSMKLQVALYGTLPILLPGPTYDYVGAVEEEMVVVR